MSPSKTPPPPYYAVIFTSIRTPVDGGYAEVRIALVERAYNFVTERGR